MALALLSLATACSSLPTAARAAPERWGFVAPWDGRSAASARTAAGGLDALVLGWIVLDSLTGLPLQPLPDSLSRTLPAGGMRMAMVTSLHSTAFHPALIRRLAMDSIALARTAAGIADLMQRAGWRGLVIDFQGMTSADTALTRAVVATIAGTARARGLGPVAVTVPATDTAAYPARLFQSSADLLVVMLYDQHWSTSPPGAVAEPGWVRRSLAMRVAEAGASRLVAALPAYGYLWRPNGAPAAAISFDDARRLAAESGVALERDPATSTLRAIRADGERWELWVSDALLLAALEREVGALNVRRIALWRLGMEDPAIWRR